jgi:hypothetical protein
MVFMVLVAPFANALIGGLLWLGMRLVGLLGATTLRQLPAGRVMVAAMLGLAVAGLVAAPFSLLGQGAVPIWIWPWCFAAAFVVSRAIGASVRVNPWWVVLGAVVAYLVLVCVIGCLVGLAIAAAFKG